VQEHESEQRAAAREEPRPSSVVRCPSSIVRRPLSAPIKFPRKYISTSHSTFNCMYDSAGLQDEVMVTRHMTARGRTATGGTTATGDKRRQGSAGQRDDGNGRHDEAAR
jgi:hypothetical protein